MKTQIIRNLLNKPKSQYSYKFIFNVEDFPELFNVKKFLLLLQELADIDLTTEDLRLMTGLELKSVIKVIKQNENT